MSRQRKRSRPKTSVPMFRRRCWERPLAVSCWQPFWGGLALGGRESLPWMIVLLILGTIGAIVTGVQYWRSRASAPPPVSVSGGKGPYRRYEAKPSSELYDRLGGTVQALRDAASDKNWMMDWKKVDEFQKTWWRVV